jgi:hypothetical protein
MAAKRVPATSNLNDMPRTIEVAGRAWPRITSLHASLKKQPKVDKTPDGPYDGFGYRSYQGMTSHHAIDSDFQNSLIFFPVLRENGIIGGAASLRMIGGEGVVMPRYVCTI